MFRFRCRNSLLQDASAQCMCCAHRVLPTRLGTTVSLLEAYACSSIHGQLFLFFLFRFSCTARTDGNYKDLNNVCSQWYWMCKNGIASIKFCDDGLVSLHTPCLLRYVRTRRLLLLYRLTTILRTLASIRRSCQNALL